MSLKLIRTSLLLALSLLPAAVSGQSQPATTKVGSGGQLFDHWVVKCETHSIENLSCAMSQVAIAEEDSEPLLRTNIRYRVDPNDYIIQFVLPLGISLRTLPELSLDGTLIAKLPYDLCLQDGCYVMFRMNGEILEKFLSMQQGMLSLVTGSGEAVNLPISGKGSRAAFNAMQVMANSLKARQSKSAE